MNKNSKMMPREITCASCGAHYGAEQLRCPYCGSVNDLADEKGYMQDLGDLREKMEKLPSETASSQTKEAIHDIGHALRRAVLFFIAAAAVIGGIVLVSRVLEDRSDRAYEEAQREEYLWTQENFPRLDALYEQEDYDGLLELSEELREGPLYKWSHYDLLEGLQLIERTREDIGEADRLLQAGEERTERYEESAAWVLYEELQLYFFDYKCRIGKDCDVIRERAQFAFTDLETRFAPSEEEMAAFEETARESSGYIPLKACSEFVAKHR